jgi:hypothetical protein
MDGFPGAGERPDDESRRKKRISVRPVDKAESDVNIRDPSTGNDWKGRPAKAGKTVLFNK